MHSISRLANVLIAGEASPSFLALSAKLGEGGYDTLTRNTIGTLCQEAKKSQPDLLIIDLPSSQFDLKECLSELRAEAGTAAIPIAFSGAEGSPEEFELALSESISDLFDNAISDEEFLIRLKPLLRTSTLRAELQRRTALAQKFGVDIEQVAKPEKDATPYKIMAVGGDAEDHLKIEDALEGHCILDKSEDLFASLDMLYDTPYDACVMVPNDETETDAYFEFCVQTRSNPRLFNLPMVMLAAPGLFSDAADPYRHGVSYLLSDALGRERLRYVLLTLVERQRQRWATQKSMEATKQAVILDDITDGYSFAFMKAHTEALVDTAQVWKKQLTLVFLSVPNVADIRREFGEEAAQHLVLQVFHWITGMTRIEDMTARYNENTFCIVLPDTPLSEASFVMERVSSVLSHTDFALHEVYQPIPVSVEMGIAELRAEDTADALIARAHERLA
jgi:two-component system, cell cycle response regulator